MRRLARGVAVAALLVLGTWCLASVAHADNPLDRTLNDDRITESSGLAFSALHPGVLYTHNDSGDGPRVFAVDPDGSTAAVLTLRGAQARDWEAIAPGKAGSGTFWVGDIGDNLGAWPSVRVYRVAEPRTLSTRDVDWTQYDLTYPDGPHNAESLLVHPKTGRLYVVTKNVMGGALYEAPKTLSSTAPNVLERVSKALAFATDAAFSPDGRHYVVRGYVNAVIYDAARPGTKVATIDLPSQPQGESIAWSPDGSALVVGSEGTGSKVYRVAVPAQVRAATASPGASTSTETIGPGGGDVPDESGGLPRAQLWWLAAGAVVLIALGASLRAWSKHNQEGLTGRS